MFERFTERARQVVVQAQDIARARDNEYVEDKHILLCLILEEEGLASKVLVELGFNAEEVRDEIAFDGAHEPLGGTIPYTASVKKTFELALREALSLGHNYIGTEHILLGLLEASGNISTLMQKKLGDKWKEIVRLEVMELLRGPRGKFPAASVLNKKYTEAQDVLADLLTGFKMWRDHKQATAEWTDADEALSRWVEGSEASEYL